ncbi:MAG: tetratricopeptide repeat protein [Candidatus Eisenbacteria bacterium]
MPSERATIAAAAVIRANRWLLRGRERIDYGLAASLHEWSRADAGERAAALEALAHCLEAHPESPARADLRYRLAEAELAEGQAHPARFDPARPLALFRAIWDSDPTYPHRDLALFQIGRLETELGDPEGAQTLASFLERFPNSSYAQEAELRLADLAFDERDYAAAIPHFERATRGGAAALTGIALYKLGWSYYGRDRFGDAAAALTRLLDLYESRALANARFDLRGEAEEILVHSLARGGRRVGLSPPLRGPWGPAPTRSACCAASPRCSPGTASTPRRSRPIASTSIASAHAPRHSRSREAGSRRRRIAIVPSKRRPRDSSWRIASRRGVAGPRARATHFARKRGSIRSRTHATAAEARHATARRGDRATDWDAARQLYTRLLAQWPADSAQGAWELASGEACAHLARHDEAAEHFHRASLGRDALAAEAAFQEVASLDAGYRAEQTGSRRADRARRFLFASSSFSAAHPEDERAADLLLREGELGLRHAGDLGSDSLGTRALRDFARRFERDPRAPQAMVDLAAHYEKAGASAEAASTLGELARRWPERDDAPVALYKSGATYASIDSTARAAQAFERVVRAYPKHELARDAMLELARVQEAGGDSSAAAASYARFSALYPRDDDAGSALLRAIALWDRAKEEAPADAARRDYLARYPDDLEARFEFMRRFARRDFEEQRAAKRLDALLATPTKKGKKPAPPTGDLAAYRELAARDPERADHDFLAEIDFARAEELRAAYDALALSLPLDRSIATKQASLERCLSAYRATLDRRVPRWSSAATFRMGEVVVAFGDALRASPRPPDLSDADRTGYEALLEEQAWSFFDRGEAIWGELLRASGESAPDPDGWLARTRHALWPRVAARFLHYPEASHPTLLPDEGRND